MHRPQTATSYSQRKVRSFVLSLALGLLGQSSPLGAQVPRNGLRAPDRSGQVPDSAKTAHYRIRARYDETKQRIRGQLALRWTNRQNRPARNLALRAYMNAFSHTQGAWMQETGAHYRGNRVDPKALGYLHIHRIDEDPAASGPNQWPDIRSPNTGLPWQADADPSIIWVELSRSVAPGQSIDLQIEFTTQLPFAFARTGFAKGFVMAAQWYPKLAVYSEHGWQAPRFTFHSEFHSDFADYDVAIELPATWELAGTGENSTLAPELVAKPGRRWHQRRAQMVVDFAWAAMPEGQLISAQLEDIEVIGLFAPDYLEQDTHHLALITELLPKMQARYGPFPWRHLSFVVPPLAAKGTQGMEYPTFFATEPMSRAQLPAQIYRDEAQGSWTTIHEFGHQYFQSLVASNEAMAPWLDEGLNTLTDAILFEDIFGKGTGVYTLFGYPLPPVALLREALYGTTFLAPIDQPATSFHPDAFNYGATVYARCALVFLTLRSICADGALDQALRGYVERFAFDHPSSQQARRFFEQALKGQCLTDGASLNIEAYFSATLDAPFEFDLQGKLHPPRVNLPSQGWVRSPQKPLDPPTWQGAPSDAVTSWEQKLVLYRSSKLPVPVELELINAAGGSQTKIWPANTGQELVLSHRFANKNQTWVRAILDPEHKLAFERKKNNNILDLPGQPLRQEVRAINQAPLSILRALQIFTGSLL